MTRTVVFAQRHMVHVRVPLYEKLREASAAATEMPFDAHRHAHRTSI